MELSNFSSLLSGALIIIEMIHLSHKKSIFSNYINIKIKWRVTSPSGSAAAALCPLSVRYDVLQYLLRQFIIDHRYVQSNPRPSPSFPVLPHRRRLLYAVLRHHHLRRELELGMLFFLLNLLPKHEVLRAERVLLRNELIDAVRESHVLLFRLCVVLL